MYICFKLKEKLADPDCLAFYFDSSKWHRGVSDIAGEGARNHGLLNISVDDYFDTKHRLPSVEEQKHIAEMLNAISQKETDAIRLGSLFEKQKQYLLRQMFI